MEKMEKDGKDGKMDGNFVNAYFVSRAPLLSSWICLRIRVGKPFSAKPGTKKALVLYTILWG
jgi:hypothetical protein